MTSLYQRHPSVEGVSLDQQEVLFHATTNKFVLVNPVGCAVWRQIEGGCAPDAIARDLHAQFTGVPGDAAAQVEGFLAQLTALQFAVTTSSMSAAKLAAPPQPRSPYHAPALREVTEEEVLASFQMTAAEISAASCWWSACSTGCP